MYSVSQAQPQLLYIRQGQKLPWVGPLTAPVTLAVDVARSIVRAPLVWAEQGTNDIATTPPVHLPSRADADAIAKELICQYQFGARVEECRKNFEFRKSPLCLPFDVRERSDPPAWETTLSSEASVFRISVGEDLRRCRDMGAKFVAYTATIPTRLLIEPVVDALGTSAWENFRQARTQLLPAKMPRKLIWIPCGLESLPFQGRRLPTLLLPHS